MKLEQLNRWELSPSEAIEVQRKLAGKIRGGKLPEVRTVLGVDVSYRREDKTFMAAAVMLQFPEMALKQSMCVQGATAIYDRAGYWSDMRRAWELWARRLTGILTGQAPGKVVRIK
ncbi:MAG TPA: hypothetical protein ENH32_01320 [Proteobacteria bacterium]|nr:endonuclease V [bacterium BMS3Abin14]HDL52594.1 hypothetical protein [Pseudomonadota bacterium]